MNNQFAEDRLELACRAFYETDRGFTNWDRLCGMEPDLAQEYRVAMARALTATKAPYKDPVMSADQDVAIEYASRLADQHKDLLGRLVDVPVSGSRCDCTPAIAGISDGPNAECPEHGEKPKQVHESEYDRALKIGYELAKVHTFTLADGEAIARAALTLAAPVQPSSTVDEIADVLGFIDKTIDNGEGGTWKWGNAEVMEMLAEIRGKVEAIGTATRVVDVDELSKFIDDWYDRWAGPGESWVASDLARAVVEAIGGETPPKTA